MLLPANLFFGHLNPILPPYHVLGWEETIVPALADRGEGPSVGLVVSDTMPLSFFCMFNVVRLFGPDGNITSPLFERSGGIGAIEPSDF